MVKVAFLHPDLGIGGAEQLVVNLAMLCQSNGWDVKIITPYCDKNRAFEQVKDGTIKVEVIGNWFPRRICGKLQALCEYIRIFIASIYLILFGGGYDLIIVDQIPISIPLLILRYKVMFYCHFPDKLLCVERKSILKKIYRFFIDTLEELCILFSGVIVVNSNFTREVFKKNFRIINLLRAAPQIVYPCSDLKNFDSFKVTKESLYEIKEFEALKSNKDFNLNDLNLIISLNRYERKKNLMLALKSFVTFMENSKNTNNYLVIAGGYDDRLPENVEVYDSLKKEIPTNLKDNIFLLRSISNRERCVLLKNADLVLYTPKNEHFGIVPCEAMYCGAFVVAHKSGGPLETVLPEYGYQVNSEEPSDWSEIITNHYKKKKCSKNDLKEYIERCFSLDSMNKTLVSILEKKWGKTFNVSKK